MPVIIIKAAEPYRVDEYLRNSIKGKLVRQNKFSDEEKTFLSQESLFPSTLYVSNLSKEDELEVETYILKGDYSGHLVYEIKPNRSVKFKGLNAEVIDLPKYTKLELIKELSDVLSEFEILWDEATLYRLIDYSEYLTNESINFYNLHSFVKTFSGGHLTADKIRDFHQSSTNDAFKLLTLNGAALDDYFKRLDVHPYQMIGALLYTLRIQFKMKIEYEMNLNLNVSAYQKKMAATPLSKVEILNRMKDLNDIKNMHASEDVLRSLIYSALQ